MHKVEQQRVAEAFGRITDPEVRRTILQFIESQAPRAIKPKLTLVVSGDVRPVGNLFRTAREA